MLSYRLKSFSIVVFLVFAACQSSDEAVNESATSPPAMADAVQAADLVGTWRATLASPGGELPFALRFEASEPPGSVPVAMILNGEEEVEALSTIDSSGALVLAFPTYDAEITARAAGDDRLKGSWRKTGADGDQTVMAFAAEAGDAPRFSDSPSGSTASDGTASDGTASPTAPASIAGSWAVTFTDDDGSEPARGEFSAVDGQVLGTFLTPTGDYRYLAGSYRDGLLRLSTFDGAHAFLFHARGETTPDGPRLTGDFWSRDSYHATWEGRPLADGEEVLPDAWSEVQLQDSSADFTFSFPVAIAAEQQLTPGEAYTYPADGHRGKVVLVNLFGSWCPNCNDEAPLLARWHREFADQGLAIIGLAYEHTGDAQRDREMVQRFADRHSIEYPLLVAGISDKSAAAATLPALSSVKSYPTTIFIGRDGTVRRIHSGFAGPGTGEHHERLVAELEGLLGELLAEPVPGG